MELRLSLALSSDGPAGAPALRLNKRELARVLSVSLPTVGAWIERYPDFPVLQSGTNGREYQFDPVAVRAFIAARQAEEERVDAERAAAIDQLGLALEDQADGAPAALTARERLDHVRALQAEDKLRVERGFLVSVPAPRQAMNAAIARMNRTLTAALRQGGRDFNLPDAVVRGLLERIAEAQRQLIRELGDEAGLTGADRTLV